MKAHKSPQTTAQQAYNSFKIGSTHCSGKITLDSFIKDPKIRRNIRTRIGVLSRDFSSGFLDILGARQLFLRHFILAIDIVEATVDDHHLQFRNGCVRLYWHVSDLVQYVLINTKPCIYLSSVFIRLLYTLYTQERLKKASPLNTFSKSCRGPINTSRRRAVYLLLKAWRKNAGIPLINLVMKR